MAEEKEILKYELDVTDIEAKSQRLLQLNAQLAAARAKGEKTDELEAQMNKELDGLGKLAQKKVEDLSAGEQLAKNKEKLAMAMGLVASGAGETAGKLGGVIQMLVAGGPAMAGFTAAAVGLTSIVVAFRAIQEEARKATEEQQKFNEAVREGQGAKLGTAAQIAADLDKFGARSAVNVDSALRLSQTLRKDFGFNEQQAAGVAGIATAAELSLEDAAVLAQMKAQNPELQVRTPQEAQAALAKARANGDYAKLLGKARETDLVREKEKTIAMAPGARGGAQQRPIELAYEGAKRSGAIPREMTLEEFKDVVGAAGQMEEISGRGFTLPTSQGFRHYLRPWDYPRHERLRKLRDKYGNWPGEYVEQAADVQAEGGAPVGDVPIDAEVYNPKQKAGKLDGLDARKQQITVHHNQVIIGQQVVPNPLRWENFWFPGYAGDSARGGNR